MFDFKLFDVMQEDLEKEIDEGSSENEAYAKIFGKEHAGYVRGMGFGVCPSQVFKSTSNHGGGTSSSCSHGSETAKIQQMEVELKENKAAVSILQAQVNYFLKHYMGGVVPSDFPTIGGNGVNTFLLDYFYIYIHYYHVLCV